MELIEAADLDDALIHEFESGLQGRILRAGDPDYDVARRHYNALINKHPALIVQCAGVADVIDAVNFARTHRVLVAVRGGGRRHCVLQRSHRDGRSARGAIEAGRFTHCRSTPPHDLPGGAVAHRSPLPAWALPVLEVQLRRGAQR
jgi:hypothetical protein